MEFDIIFDRLLNYYHITSVTDLAEKLNTTRSTVSGWKSRKALGVFIEKISEIEPKALEHIFSSDSQINNIDSTTINGNNGSVIDNSSNKAISGLTSNNKNLIPKEIIHDLEGLFQMAQEKEKKEKLLNNFDDFVFSTKKILRDLKDSE